MEKEPSLSVHAPAFIPQSMIQPGIETRQSEISVLGGNEFSGSMNLRYPPQNMTIDQSRRIPEQHYPISPDQMYGQTPPQARRWRNQNIQEIDNRMNDPRTRLFHNQNPHLVQGMNQTMNPGGMNPVMNPGLNSVMNQGGMNQGMNPGGMNQGMNPGGGGGGGGGMNMGINQGNMNQGNINQGNINQGGMNQGGMNQGGMNQGGMSSQPTGSDEVKTSKAITVEHRMIKPGEYSTWVRVLSADLGPAQLSAVLSRCEESNNKGTIYIYLREKFVNRQLIQQMKSQGYKFHHFVEETQSFVYGKKPQEEEEEEDEEACELANATSKELVGSIILSPDEKKVLLIWEGGKWTYASGLGLTRESALDALKRELRAQFNIEIDKSFHPRIVGGWNKPSGKFDCINEVFTCFVVKSTVDDFSGKEIHTNWFEIDQLMWLLEQTDQQFQQSNTIPVLDTSIELPHGNIFSHLVLRWLKVYVSGLSWAVNTVADRTIFCAI